MSLLRDGPGQWGRSDRPGPSCSPSLPQGQRFSLCRSRRRVEVRPASPATVRRCDRGTGRRVRARPPGVRVVPRVVTDDAGSRMDRRGAEGRRPVPRTDRRRQSARPSPSCIEQPLARSDPRTQSQRPGTARGADTARGHDRNRPSSSEAECVEVAGLRADVDHAVGYGWRPGTEECARPQRRARLRGTRAAAHAARVESDQVARTHSDVDDPVRH